MRIKVVGYKAGESNPTTNRTVNALIGEGQFEVHDAAIKRLGQVLYEALQKSDFINIWCIEP